MAEDSWWRADNGEDVSSKHGGDHNGGEGKMAEIGVDVLKGGTAEVA